MALIFSGFVDQLTLVRLKHAAALFSSFSATCSMDCVVSFNDSSELQAKIQTVTNFNDH